ncbi:MAG: hypothetical protein R2706_16185 [Acidimicrobiales bacterium]
MREQLLAAVHIALAELGVAEVPAGVTIERPARKEHGDWSTNAALVCSNPGPEPPRNRSGADRQPLTANTPAHVGVRSRSPVLASSTSGLAPTWLYDVM